jgi:hypothetical protein
VCHYSWPNFSLPPFLSPPLSSLLPLPSFHAPSLLPPSFPLFFLPLSLPSFVPPSFPPLLPLFLSYGSI